MFIRLRMMAHNALKQYMANGTTKHPPLTESTQRLIYDTIVAAENDDAFANELDYECSNTFVDGMAEGFDDLIQLFSEMPDGLRELLANHGISRRW